MDTETEILHILANMLANLHSQAYLSVKTEALHTAYVSRRNVTHLDELAFGYIGKLLAPISSTPAKLR